MNAQCISRKVTAINPRGARCKSECMLEWITTGSIRI